ncbi:hypothetical protein NRA33_17400 [Acinetobacter baumannii]|uniref:hypothetical protein n=1 Tax=Acinetobacter baumannii TaxID=470 RepID=UPI00233FC79D|nr:hypothetical protein [Acinetobacter baumannii]EHU1483933.1 hypothetical protein [Acinetobacter baumannii]EHU2704296.1 hypothetical protein [Acinetobacter baumannii]MDC5324451.1 hypothetical protein [Acinetobacter baumannii]
MSKNVVAFSISVSVILLAILIWCVFGILFKYWGDTTAIKDSLSTISGIFGGLTTLAAAIIAAHLYTNWREQLTSTVQQEQAKSIQLAVNKILITLDDYATFILMHGGMGHEPEYIKEASEKAQKLIKEYPSLAFNLKLNLVSYEETFLNNKTILTTEEMENITWWYYYGIINLLNRIIKKEHLQQIDNFQIYISALKRDREIFQSLKMKINSEMIPNINFQEAVTK